MTNNQSGNALFFILIGVVLLGLLTMVLSRGGTSSGQSGDFEQRQVKVSQMLRYAGGLEAGIEQMRLRGISENDISFENAVTATDYTNANCTTTDCLIFDDGGGGLTYTAPPIGISNGIEEWVFSGDNNVAAIGTTSPDLVLFLVDIKTSVCDHINRVLGSSYGGTETDVDFTAFTGTYTATQAIDLANGQQAGCIEYDFGAGTENLFYYVLHKR